MNLTSEQQAVIDHIVSTKGLTLVSSVAGSGKTTLLKALSETVPHTNGLYLAYNKSIATASKKAFTSSTNCVTTHSLAYQATVKQYKLKIGTFTYRNITDKVPYLIKCQIVDLLREFCLSKYLTYDEFVDNYDEDISKTASIVTKYLTMMQEGTIEITHDFYLKLFHILLASDEIHYDEFDFVLLDEAGDVNPVTAEIFMLLPTERRVAVGDPHQNIYSFNHTINCFETLSQYGDTFSLSQSFRVPDTIALQVEQFCKDYMQSDIVFKGVPLKDRTITTRGYIARTNAILIAEMIQLNHLGTPYGLVRKASEIFKIPLMVTGIKQNGYISNPAYSHLQADYDAWYDDSSLQALYKSPLAYISFVHEDDIALVNAIKIVMQFGKKLIMDTYFEAKQHESKKQNLILTTAHSCKGLQFDEVTIANDLNRSIEDIITFIRNNPDAPILPDQKEALNLYYVAITRALKRLNNAEHLKRYKPIVTTFQEKHYPEDLL